jgi:hypothetical protein
MSGQLVPSPKNPSPRRGGSRVPRTGREESGPLSGPRKIAVRAMYRIPQRTSSAPSPIRNILASQFIAAPHNRTGIQAHAGPQALTKRRPQRGAVGHLPSAILSLPAFVSRSPPDNSCMYPSWISRSLCSAGIVRCIKPLAQSRNEANSSRVNGGAEKPCAILRICAYGGPVQVGFPSGRLTSSNEGTWVLSHHDFSAAPQTVQTALPVCGTKNFVSVRLYSAPQLHRTIVAILGICP